MPFIRLLLLSVVALSLSGCVVHRVHSHTNPEIELGRYRHYAWAPPVPWQTGDARLDNNHIFRAHVQKTIDRHLAGKGFVRESSLRSAELVVRYHATVVERVDVQELAPWDLCTNCKPFVFDAGTLVVDLIDADTQALVWRGWSEGNMNGLIDSQHRLEAEADRIVERIFAVLPGRPLTIDLGRQARGGLSPHRSAAETANDEAVRDSVANDTKLEQIATGDERVGWTL